MWPPTKPSSNYTPVRTKRPKPENAIEACRDHNDEWEPFSTKEFLPTDAPSGSAEKIEVLRRRVEQGLPLWHRHDRVDYAGLKALHARLTPPRS